MEVFMEAWSTPSTPTTLISGQNFFSQQATDAARPPPPMAT